MCQNSLRPRHYKNRPESVSRIFRKCRVGAKKFFVLYVSCAFSRVCAVLKCERCFEVGNCFDVSTENFRTRKFHVRIVEALLLKFTHVLFFSY